MAVVRMDLAPSKGHAFHARLNRARDLVGFDGLVEAQWAWFYADGVGRRRPAPGWYFRLLRLGYFEGLDAERGIAWRMWASPTPMRAQLPQLDQKRSRKGSNDDWPHPPHPQDLEAKAIEIKGGRTYLASRAEQTVELETGVVVGIIVENAAAGDTEMMVDLNGLGPARGLGTVREPCLRQMVDWPASNRRRGRAGFHHRVHFRIEVS